MPNAVEALLGSTQQVQACSAAWLNTPFSVFGLSPAPTPPQDALLGLSETEQRGACHWARMGMVPDAQKPHWKAEARLEALKVGCVSGLETYFCVLLRSFTSGT